MNEDEKKEKNREETMKRSRMWQVVGDDDDSASDSDSDSSDDSDSDSASSGQREKDHKKHHKKSSDRDKHKDKKSKKSKKEKKDKKKHKKEKKEKKEKKKHRDRDKDKDKHQSHKRVKTAVDQNEYGKYGIIREDHYFQKQREFEAYIFEVKKLPGLFGQGKAEVAEYFRSYVEDYNTATMPHEKYYDLARWEMKEYQAKQQKSSSSRKQYDNDEDIPVVFNDEAARAAELKAARAAREQKEFSQTLGRVAADKERLQGMRRQSELQGELRAAYKRGDNATVKRLEKVLAPDEEKGGGMKHPWAS